MYLEADVISIYFKVDIIWVKTVTFLASARQFGSRSNRCRLLSNRREMYHMGIYVAGISDF
jgi:hypothetical protein